MNDIKKMDPRVIALIIIVLLVGAVIAYFGTKGTAMPETPGMPTGLSSEEVAPMLEKMRAFGPVPEEVPQTIVIANAALARAEQPFLENAEDGDVLFLFIESKLVFLYRPSTSTIIAVGPLNDGPPPAPAS